MPNSCRECLINAPRAHQTDSTWRDASQRRVSRCVATQSVATRRNATKIWAVGIWRPTHRSASRRDTLRCDRHVWSRCIRLYGELAVWFSTRRSASRRVATLCAYLSLPLIRMKRYRTHLRELFFLRTTNFLHARIVLKVVLVSGYGRNFSLWLAHYRYRFNLT